MSTEEVRIAAERRLAELDEEVAHLRALLAIYNRGAFSPRSASAGDGDANFRSRRQSRAYSDEWAPIARFLLTMPDDPQHYTTLDELEEFDRSSGANLGRDRIRQQMHNWKNRRFVVNPAQGKFGLTPEGRAAFRNEDDANAESVASSEEIESKDEPNVLELTRFDLLNPRAA